MKSMKHLACMFAAAVFAAGSLFAFDPASFDTQKISDGLDDFTQELTVAIPQAATQQNVWADAYIGKLFPSVPVHLGGGFNVGLTHLDTSGLAMAAGQLGIDGIKDNYYMPVFTADLRIGGILLPFDLDLAVMKTGKIGTKQMGADLDFDFLTFGADFRYALIQGNVVLPKVSVGAGYFYNQGTFSASSDYADATIEYKTQTMYVQAQVSKKFLFLTPFAGVRGLVSSSDNSWNWNITDSTASATLLGLSKKSSDSGTVKSDGLDFSELQPQVFAGIGFDFLVLQATASVTADLRNITDYGLWSGAVSLRIKI
jgi:hypothetical protein